MSNMTHSVSSQINDQTVSNNFAITSQINDFRRPS